MEYRTNYGDVGISVMVQGQEVLEFPHFDGHTYICSRERMAYSILLWNFTPRRVEVVLSVDGLDVLSGKVVNKLTQRGYVLNPHSKPKPIAGFSTEGCGLVNFVFASSGIGYSSIVDKPTTPGVISAAFYLERANSELPEYHRLLNESLASGIEYFSSGSSANVKNSGEESSLITAKKPFVRDKIMMPTALFVINYLSKEALRNLGVKMGKTRVSSPEHFSIVNEECPPPPEWNPAG